MATASPKASASVGATPSVVASPTTDPNAIVTPNLSGLTQQSAVQQLSANNIPLGLGKELPARPSETVPRGQIIDQDPKAGTIVKRNSQIDIAYSLGPSIVDLSGLNVKGKPYDDVVTQLTALGLKSARQDELSPDVDAGRVTRTDPLDHVVHDSTVTVYVSLGKPTPTAAPATATPTVRPPTATPTVTLTPSAGNAAIPNVIGKTPDDAQKQFEQAGFTNIQIGQLSSSVLPSGAPKQKKGTVAAVINGQEPPSRERRPVDPEGYADHHHRPGNGLNGSPALVSVSKPNRRKERRQIPVATIVGTRCRLPARLPPTP